MNAKPTPRIGIAAIVLPAIWPIVAAILLTSWRSDLPDPIAVHWGARSMPDGFGSAGQPILIMAVLALVAIAAGVATTLTAPSSSVARSFAGLTAGISVFLSGVVLVSTAVQRGVADAAVVAFPGWVIPVAAAVAIGAGLVAAAIIPDWAGSPGAPVGDPVQALPISADERVVWSSSVTAPLPVVLLAGLGVVATLIPAVLLGMWWMLTISVALVAATATMLTIRVTVDRSGLRVRSALGWPRTRTAAGQIASVGTTRVRALRDFGGFGYRIAVHGHLRGARGFILRSGEALVVTTRDGGTEVVVVDDAETGAAVLEAVRQREDHRTR